MARPAETLRRIKVQVQTYWADTRARPSWALMFIFGRFNFIRKALWRMAAPEPATSYVGGSMFANVDPYAVADSLRTKGIFPGLQLPADVTKAIRKFADETPCYGQFDRSLHFLPADIEAAQARSSRPILVGHYFDDIEFSEACRRVRDDPLIWKVARLYLGSKARVISTRMWWSFPSKTATDADLRLASQDRLHFDLDDWRTLKFFFYITEAGEGAGPHSYVQNSHRKRPLSHQLTVFVGHPAEKVLAAYGSDNLMPLLGPPGYGFAEDPFGFHSGGLATTRPRLVMELGFGVSSSSPLRFYGERAPAVAPILPPTASHAPAHGLGQTV